MLKRSIGYMVVSALLLSVLILGVEPLWTSPSKAAPPSYNSYLVWLKHPEVTGVGISTDDYTTAYLLQSRAQQEYLIPSLLDLKSNRFIESFDLSPIPNTIIVQSSTDCSIVLSSLPNVIKVTEANESQVQTAVQDFSSGIPTSYIVTDAPGLYEFVVYQTEGFITGKIGSAGTPVTVQITNRSLTYNGTTAANGWYTIGGDFRPGDTVQVSALGVTRQITLPTTFSVNANIDTNIIGGAAPAGSTIHTELWREPVPNSSRFEHSIDAAADGSGQYAANYGAVGRDITRTNYVYAKYMPNGQDTVAIVSHPSFLRINESQNFGYGYLAPFSTVNLRLLNSQAGVKATGTFNSSFSGLFWVQFTNLDGSTVDIVPTDSVEASAAGTTIVLNIPSISAAVTGATTVSGSISPASAGSPVGIEIIGQGMDEIRDTTLNASGQFSVNFEVSHISQMQYGMVFHYNADGNQAFVYFTSSPAVPTPTPPVYVPPTPTPPGWVSPTPTRTPVPVPTIDPTWHNRLYLPLILRNFNSGW